MPLPNWWRAALPEDWEAGGFGLYLHWPFCQSKCPYCDFNSHVVARIDQNRWRDAYLSEIARLGSQTQGRMLRSIYFGGGTPSLMEPELVAAILGQVQRTWQVSNDVEITLEANPTSAEAGRFRGYRDAGVNRVSMGLQALNDPDLRALGRLHTAAEGMAAFDVARAVFDRVSFDLIYARQNQPLDAWKTELQQALSFADDHLSMYQLTIEEGTAFGDRYTAGKLRGLPDDDLGADMYAWTQDICAKAGFESYEVSNYAKPGYESRHNLIYWRYGDYVGIGPGAHGRLTKSGHRFATEGYRAPGAWLSAVETKGNGDCLSEGLSSADMLAEFLLMGLRLTEGVERARFDRLGGSIYCSNIKYLREIGMIEDTSDRLRVTQAGRPVLNSVLQQLLRD